MNEQTFEYPVRLDDLDFMGVVGDNQWLTFLQRARIDYMEHIGFPYSEMVRQKIAGVVTENHIRYLRPAIFGDHLKIIISGVCNERGVSLKYRIEKKGKACILSDMQIVFIDSTSRPTEIPEAIRMGLT